MAWRRGRGPAPVELANVQSKMEQWSDVLDGDDGVINSVLDDLAERKAIRGFIKLSLWLGGLCVGLPAFVLSVVEVIRLINGK